MIAYLSVINNPGDEIRLRRIINTPKRGIGDKSADTAAQIGQQIGEGMFQVITHPGDFPAISRAVANKLQSFAAMMQGLMDKNESGMSPSELYAELLVQTNYVEFLRADDPEKAEGRVENVQELSSMLQRYEQENGEEASLSGFLEEVSLFTDIDNYDAQSDSVVLMTVHSAKGLEFPVVFLPGWEEGVFPGNAVLFDPSQVEEERRLAYVAITRAREELYIYNAESRMIFGSTSRNRISRFAQEVPEELIERGRSREYVPRAGAAAPNRERAAAQRTIPAYRPAPHKPAPAGTYQVGDSVQHKTFGTGLILSATPMANDTLLEIAFDRAGTKKLMANFARLTKV